MDNVAIPQQFRQQRQGPVVTAANNADKRFTEYKVIVVCESGCSTLLVGAASLPTDILQQRLNQEALNGWQCVFQIIERRRFLLFWTREAIICTLAR